MDIVTYALCKKKIKEAILNIETGMSPEDVIDVVTNATQNVYNNLSNQINMMNNSISTNSNIVLNILNSQNIYINNIGSIMNNTLNSQNNYISNMSNLMNNNVNNIYNIMNGQNNYLNNSINNVYNITNAQNIYINNVLNAQNNYMTNTITNMSNFMNNTLNAQNNLINIQFSNMNNYINNTFNAMNNATNIKISNISNTMNIRFNAQNQFLNNSLNNMYNTINTTYNNITANLKGYVDNTANNIYNDMNLADARLQNSIDGLTNRLDTIRVPSFEVIDGLLIIDMQGSIPATGDIIKFATIKKVSIDGNNHLICHMSDGTILDAGELPMADQEVGGCIQVPTAADLPYPGKTGAVYLLLDTEQLLYYDEDDTVYRDVVTNGVAGEIFTKVQTHTSSITFDGTTTTFALPIDNDKVSVFVNGLFLVEGFDYEINRAGHPNTITFYDVWRATDTCEITWVIGEVSDMATATEQDIDDLFGQPKIVNCPICNSSNTTFQYDNNTKEGYQCDDCGQMFEINKGGN